ncbi:MAG TPA: HEAT repeat domain-containing protein [Tepidisphaeraceae bacterium]
MKHHIAASVALLILGCGATPQGPNMPDAPAPPPPSPKQVSQPIDPQLRRAAEAELDAALASSNAIIRANAIEASQRAVDSPSAVARVTKGLSDSNGLVRFAATMAAGAMQRPEWHATLIELANDRDDNVRVGARYALHKLGDFRLSHDFEKLVLDPKPSVRANAVLALGLMGEPSAMKLLQAVQLDASPAVRLQTTEAMHRLGDARAAERLMAGTISTYADDQIVSILALVQGRGPTDKVYKVLQGNLTGDYVEVNLAAARALGTIGSDEGMGVAIKAVPSKDARQRAMAALALGAIGRSDAQPHLAKLLKDSDPNVRLAAAAAVLQLRAA